jgi:4-carboxymuconolactone decarboxylase
MDAYERGMQVRRQVLGDDHVDRAVAGTTSIDSEFQRWITESAWAGVWDRPGLDQRTKSLITIAILAGLGHEELELHLKAAANTGATPNDIAEVLFHVAVYAGVPAANTAFKMAKHIYEAPGDQQ